MAVIGRAGCVVLALKIAIENGKVAMRIQMRQGSRLRTSERHGHGGSY